MTFIHHVFFFLFLSNFIKDFNCETRHLHLIAGSSSAMTPLIISKSFVRVLLLLFDCLVLFYMKLNISFIVSKQYIMINVFCVIGNSLSSTLFSSLAFSKIRGKVIWKEKGKKNDIINIINIVIKL